LRFKQIKGIKADYSQTEERLTIVYNFPFLMVLIYVLVVCFSDKEIHTYTKLLLIGSGMRDAIVKTHKKKQKKHLLQLA